MRQVRFIRTWSLVSLAMSVTLMPSVRAQQPTVAVPSARALLEAAVRRAQVEQKAVFVDFGASWCGPCLQLDAFLAAPETKPLIAAHLVVVKLTAWERGPKAALNNTGSEELMTSLGGGAGIPFYAFLDATGKKISSGSGYPSGTADIKEFLALVDASAPRITRPERASLATYLTAHSDGRGSISGRVVDDHQAGVAEARVSVIGRAYLDGAWIPVRMATAKTDVDGRYNVEPRAGDIVAVEPASAFAGALFRSAKTLSDGKRVTLQQGQGIANIDIAVSRSSATSVSGIVTSSDGKPLSQSTLSLTNVDWPLDPVSATSKPDGSFTFAQVWPGRYSLWARASPTAAQVPEMAHREVIVQGNSPASVAIRTTRGHAFTGHIIFDGPAISTSDRLAIRVTSVAVAPPPGAPRQLLESSVGADGAFDVGGLFVPTVLRVSGLPVGWMLKSISRGGLDVTDKVIDPAGVVRSDEFSIRLTNVVGEVNGTVIDGASRPVASGGLVLFADQPERWRYPSRFVRSVPVQRDGTFRVGALAAGRYLVAPLTSLEPDWDSPESLTRLRASATVVTIAEGEKKTLTVTASAR